MKFIFLSVFLLLATTTFLHAQDEQDAGQEEGTIARRMTTYIQKELDLTDEEGKKFAPAFAQYLREFRKTHTDNSSDKLVMQQKIVELRIRYRNRFREILPAQKADDVFKIEDNFRKSVLQAIKEKRKMKREKDKSQRMDL